ncbi:MAG: hypothetical protein IPK77_13050 [Cellvibrio sp.]|nr:hypothetical protein [Cellvibrio sp.]
MTTYNYEFIENDLLLIFEEMEQQHQLSELYPNNMLSFEGNMQHIREYIEIAGEYGLAYELIVVNLENYPFSISGRSAVKLLELGLIMKYKTDRDEDIIFDLR